MVQFRSISITLSCQRYLRGVSFQRYFLYIKAEVRPSVLLSTIWHWPWMSVLMEWPNNYFNFPAVFIKPKLLNIINHFSVVDWAGHPSLPARSFPHLPTVFVSFAIRISLSRYTNVFLFTANYLITHYQLFQHSYFST